MSPEDFVTCSISRCASSLYGEEIPMMTLHTEAQWSFWLVCTLLCHGALWFHEARAGKLGTLPETILCATSFGWPPDLYHS